MEGSIFQNIKILKYVFIGIAILLILISVLMFSGKFPGMENQTATDMGKTITIYGVIPEEVFNKAVDNYNIYNGKQLQFDYHYIPKERIRDSIVTWASKNSMPDLIIADADTITSYQTYFQLIPYSEMTALDYQNTFVDGASVYTTALGFYFYPLSVDPLITFYNKKVIREKGLPYPLNYWSEGAKYQKSITEIDKKDNLLLSAFAFAGDNVHNNKDILFAMLSQVSGRVVSPQIAYNPEGASVNYSLNLGFNQNGVSELYNILFFQNAFTDPLRSTYTWNPLNNYSDKDAFVDGRLAMYFGKASEYSEITSLNSSLDIGLNYLPQSTDNIVTSGDIYGIAITAKPADQAYAYSISKLLSSYDFSSPLSIPMMMSSARRDTLAGSGGTILEEVLGRSALMSEFVFSNNTEQIQYLVSDLYKNINSGRESILDSIDIFVDEFESIYNPESE